MDLRLPGMLNAALGAMPVFKGTLKSVDDSKARDMPGARKNRGVKDAVAVVADTFWHAQKAAEALTITWNDGHNGSVSSDSIANFVRSGSTRRTPASDARRQCHRQRSRAPRSGSRPNTRCRFWPMPPWSRKLHRACDARSRRDLGPRRTPEASLAAAAQGRRHADRNVMVQSLMIGGAWPPRLVQDSCAMRC